MEFEELSALICLAQKQDWQAAAIASGLSAAGLHETLDRLESRYEQVIVHPRDPFGGFTPAGELILAWAKEFCLQSEQIQAHFGQGSRRAMVDELLERRSVSPKRLCAPGPSEADLHLIVQAGLHAPDHGRLHPWRIMVFEDAHRQALADCFEQEKRRRDPLAPQKDIDRAREHASRPPSLLAFVVSPKAKTQVPVREQWLSAGAALSNVLNAAHQLGFGAIVLSGERCFDAVLCSELGVQPHESLAGFISLGSIAEPPPARQAPDTSEVISHWVPSQGAKGAPVQQAAAPPEQRHETPHEPH